MSQTGSQNAATPAPGTAGSAGCVVFLIDETSTMDARVGAGTKSKADSIATAVNSLLNQISDANLDVAIVGYRGNGQGGEEVGPRWGGPLAGRAFVHTSQLAASPVAVEDRVRKIPAPGGIGVAREEPIKFPVWYIPALGGPISLAAGYQYCQSLLMAWLTTPGITPKQPLLISLLGELADGESLEAGLGGIYQIQCAGGQPLVFHAHLKSTPQVPPILYPATNGHLPPGPIQEIFQWSGYLPEPLVESLKQFDIAVFPGARGMIYNAAMVDLIRFFSMVKAFPAYQPVLPMAPGTEAGAQAEVQSPFGAAQTDTAPESPTPQTPTETPAPASSPEQPAKTAPWSTEIPAVKPTANPLTAQTVDQASAQTPAQPLLQPLIPNAPAVPTPEQTAPIGDQSAIKPRPVVAPTPEQGSPVESQPVITPTPEQGSPAATPGAPLIPCVPQTPVQPLITPVVPTTPATQTPQRPMAAQQAPAVTGAPAPAVALVLLVMDRSVDNPADANQANVWSRLQEHANDLLGQIAKRGNGKLEAAVVSCGTDPTGQSEVQTTFGGSLAGKTFVGDAELAQGPIRVDEVKEMVSNGIGGLVELNRKKPIYIDLPPTGPAAMSPAYQAAAALVADWAGRHPGSPAPPVVLHLNRGTADTGELRQAVPDATLYHLVVTAAPHRSLAYPNQPAGTDDPVLQQLWHLSNPLLGAETLAAQKPIVKPDSRGMIVNGKFDLLLDGLLACIPGESDQST